MTFAVFFDEVLSEAASEESSLLPHAVRAVIARTADTESAKNFLSFILHLPFIISAHICAFLLFN